MARTRFIKPLFFIEENIAKVSQKGRLLLIGLWLNADREGRLLDNPRRIKAAVFPYDNVNCNDLLSELERNNLIIRYRVDTSSYIQINDFRKYQDIQHGEAASKIPAPQGFNDSIATPGRIPRKTRKLVFERDGFRCSRCHSTRNLSIDHIKPRSIGGGHDPENLQVLCRSCNSSKGARR